MKEFVVNKHLKLALEDGETKIYVGGKFFRTCKYLLVNTTLERLNDPEIIDSIDDLEEELSHELEPRYDEEERVVRKDVLSPEDEFWGHCSNLQAWAENDYDTRLLHRNLAFWLLFELSGVDSFAKHRFFEEMAERYNYGNETVREFIREFIDDLEWWSFEWALSMVTDTEQYEALLVLRDDLFKEVVSDVDVEQGKVISLRLNAQSSDVLSDEVLKFSNSLQKLNIQGEELKFLPKEFGELSKLRELSIFNTKISELPPTFAKLSSLKSFWLARSKVNKLPSNFKALSALEELRLGELPLERLPESFGELPRLRKLGFGSLPLEILPESFGELKNLKELRISNCTFNYIPQSIGDLSKLKKLFLSKVEIPPFPPTIRNLNSLVYLIVENSPTFCYDNLELLPVIETLDIAKNDLKEVPAQVCLMKTLKRLRLQYNPIKSLPKEIFELPNLTQLETYGTGIILSDYQKKKYNAD